MTMSINNVTEQSYGLHISKKTHLKSWPLIRLIRAESGESAGESGVGPRQLIDMAQIIANSVL